MEHYRSRSTLRTGLVVAGVPGQVLPAATFAVKELTAQSRGAAMGDGPDSAALLREKRGSGLEEVRQKPPQRLHDGGGHERVWLAARTNAATRGTVHPSDARHPGSFGG